MKNSPKHNPTKDVAARSTQKQQWPVNRTGTQTQLPFKPGPGVVSPHSGVSVAIAYAGIRASTHMRVRPVESIPLRAAQGDDDIMSQEKIL